MNEEIYTTLDTIEQNEKCIVVDFLLFSALDVNKLYNYGITKGAIITPLYNSVFKGASAYLVKGSVIGIRVEDAKNITVKKLM